MISRRTLLENSLKISAGLALAKTRVGFAETTASAQIRLTNAAPVKIPADFTGLGYEMSSVAPLGLLSAQNERYVQLIHGLGAEGVLRVGGIVANFTRYEPHGTIAAEMKNTVVTDETLHQFAEFLRRTGWSAIWSVNFAQGTIDDAVKEAKAVHQALGSRLLALEVGNEVDSYNKGQPFRSPTYDYAAYRREYTAWHAAIASAIPEIRFAAPDTARAYEWAEAMAHDADDTVQLLTAHYYRNGQQRGSAEQLLTPDPRLQQMLTGMRSASQQSRIPWRMCETNSFSGGGRPGVSDTFIGALWTLDFMLLLAANGCVGVNIETGVNQLGFISSYSPIQDDGKGVNSAGTPYYGMLAFAAATAGGLDVLPCELETGGVNLTAYVLGSGAKARSVALINRDRTKDATVPLSELGLSKASLLRLLAPSAESTNGVTFGGASVDAMGRWVAAKKETVRGAVVTVPAMSAAVIRA